MFEGGRKMKKHLLIIGICIVILVIPISSAVNVNTDVDDEGRDNYEVKPLDEYTEIISYVWGSAEHLDRIGLFSVNLTVGDINIISFTTSGFYSKNTDHVYMNFFIGFYPTGGFPVEYRFFGVAIGNIEW
jgi:hypothetical protein